MLLKILPKTEDIKAKYMNHGSYHDGDSGLDLFTPENIIIKANSVGIPIDMKISCEAFKMNNNKYLSMVTNVLNDDISDDNRDLIESLKNIKLEEYNVSYYLYPRSSISKTPLRMSNSIGIIDAGYRGNIIAKVDNISNKDYEIKKDTRLFQICDPCLDNIQIKIVDNLSETTRGNAGFGSTNN
jgi:dUTP pyrophosphatase